jgi:uncharacterized membrane protein HdeD (DUF308 family)
LTQSEMVQQPAPWWLVLIEGIFAVIIGVSLISAPAMTITIIVQVLGLYWLLGGILAIVSLFINQTNWGWKLVGGLLGILAGILVLRHPLWSTVLVPATLVLVIGIGGIFIGLIDLVRAFKGAGWGTGALGALSLFLGVILLLHPVQAAFASATVVGILAIVGGIVAIIMAFRGR